MERLFRGLFIPIEKISKTTRCKYCDKCFSYVSTWKVRFEHRVISKAINIAFLLIVRHYLWSISKHKNILLSFNTFIMSLFFNITLCGFANILYASFLSIILFELVPWSSSSYMINNQLDIVKTPKSMWFNSDWCLATCLTCFFTLVWVHQRQALCLSFSPT